MDENEKIKELEGLIVDMRFDLGDDVNYRECIVNLKNALDDYKDIYKLRL